MGLGKVPKAAFELGAELKEIGASDGVVRFRYTIYLETFPSVMRAEMQGLATLPASAFENADSMTEKDISDVALELFQSNYESLYLLFQSLGITAPSPWMVKDVHMVSPSLEAEKAQELAVPAPARSSR